MLCFLLFSLSLSLSLIDCIMVSKQHKSTLTWNPLQGSRSSSFFPPLIFSSMMRRPRRTSLRTSRNVAFIQNARLFCRILSTLLSLKSFGLEIGLLYLRNPQDVPSCLFRSFTPTYMALIPMCLSLLLYSEAHVS